jgi:hypothetical protein
MKLEKLIIGNFAYFVEGGTTVDATEVSITAYPDVDPITNWESLGCITETEFETEKETDTDYCPSPTGGYSKIEEEQTVRDLIKMKCRDTSEPFWRMLLGLNSKIVDETAQTPFINKRRYVEGWLKVQGRGLDGADRVVMNVWGRLKIDETPKWSKDPTKPGYVFEVIFSEIATVEPDGIIA